MNNHLNALKKRYKDKKWPRELITPKLILAQSANYFSRRQTTYEVCNNTKNISACNGIEPLKPAFPTQVTSKANQTKLAYNYNFNNSCKEKSLQLDYGEWPQHANIMETSVSLVKQPLNSIGWKTQVKKLCLCRNMANNSIKHIVA
jgi:hypothetical protein